MSRGVESRGASSLTVVGLALLAVLHGCDCGSTGVDTRRFACTEDSACTTGFVCRAGECVPEPGPGGNDGGGTDGGGTDGGTDGGLPDGGGGGGTDGGTDGGVPDGGTNPQPTQLTIITEPQSVEAGQCSSAVVIEVQSASGVATPVSADTILNLTVTPGSDLRFYRSASCGSTANTVVVRAGASRAMVYFRGTIARSYRVSVSATGLTGTGQDELIRAGPPEDLEFSSGAQTVPAGGCSSAAVLEVVDDFDNPTSFSGARTINLSGNSAAGFGFFSDAACTSAISQVSLPAGASQAGFYFQARSGGTFNLFASIGGFDTASQAETILPAVRRGNCTIADGSSSVDCDITQDQLDTDKTLLFFQAAGANYAPANSVVRCMLDDEDTVSCVRNGTTGEVYIEWQTAELPSGLRVQHLEAGCNGTNRIQVPITPVTSMQNTFLLVSSEKNGFSLDGDDFYTARLMQPDMVEFQFSQACQSTWEASLQVVEFEGVSVTRGTTALVSGQQRAVGDLPAANPATSILLFSYRLSGEATGLLCDRMVRGEMSSSTTLAFTRGLGEGTCEGDATIDSIAWERIDFGSRAQAQHFVVTQAEGVDLQELTIPAVDPTRTLVFASSQGQSGQGGGESNYVDDDPLGAVVGVHELSSPTLLTVGRWHPLGTARWTSTVVQLQVR